MTYLIFDIETTGLERTSDFICAAFSDKYFTTNIEECVQHLIDNLEAQTPIVGHNIVSYDLPLLLYQSKKREALNSLIRKNPTLIIDTLHISRREYPTWISGHDVGNWSYLLRNKHGYDVAPKPQDVDWTDMEQVRNRCMTDVSIQEALFDYLWVQRGHKISKTYRALQTYYPLCIESLAYGLPINLKEVESVRRKLKLSLLANKVSIYKDLGRLNINSPMQINKALMKKYKKGLPKTEKGNPQLNDKNRKRVCEKFPILVDVYDAKDLNAQLSFIAEGDGKKSIFGRVHPSPLFDGDVVLPELNVLATRTMRAQYKNPPLNQFDKRIRELVAAPKGWTMVGVDIIGLENAILDYTLKSMGLDGLHSEGCPKQQTLDVFGTLFDNVVCYADETMKDKAKTLNYALLYGQGLKSTCDYLNLSHSRMYEVKEAINKRFPSFNQIKAILKSSLQKEGDLFILKTMYGDMVVSPEHIVLNTWCQTSGMVYAHMLFGLFYQELVSIDIPHYCAVVNHDEAQLLFKTTDVKALEERLDSILETVYSKFYSRTKETLITKLEYETGENWKSTH